FAFKPSEEDRAEYGDAVLFGYQQMDGMIGRFMKLAGDDVTVVFATALGQQPYLDMEEAGGKRFYRPEDVDQLLTFAGIRGKFKVSPVMAEEFHVYFDSAAEAEVALRRLAALSVGGRPLMKPFIRDERDVFAGVKIYDHVEDDAVVTAEGGATR